MSAFRRHEPTCRYNRLVCYFPSFFWMTVSALAIAWLTWVMQDRDMKAIKAKHYVHGALLWFVMTPVVIGIVRGIRRSRRHVRTGW